MIPNFKTLALVITALAMPLAAAADEAKPVNEVVVVAKKSLGELRKEVFDAEEDLYDLYNELNDNSEFDVHCFYEKPTGSRIKNHVCRARFVSDAFSSQANRGRDDLSRFRKSSDHPELELKTREFEQRMSALIASNPKLEAAVIRYNTSRAEFMAKREQNSRRH